MNDRSSSRIDNLAAIVLCCLAVVACVVLVGVQRVYRIRRINEELHQQQLAAELAAEHAAADIAAAQIESRTQIPASEDSEVDAEELPEEVLQ